MSINLKNKCFSEGIMDALAQLMNKIEFSGDIAWDIVCFKNELIKQANSYKELKKNYESKYFEIHNKLINELGENGNIPPKTEAMTIFINNKERRDAEIKLNNEIKELNNKELEYDFDKISLSKDILKKNSLLPAVLSSLEPIINIIE